MLSGENSTRWVHFPSAAATQTRQSSPYILGADVQNPHFPLSLTVQHQSIRIGVVHGQQIVPAGDADMLAALARQLDVDVLVSGGTHRYVIPGVLADLLG